MMKIGLLSDSHHRVDLTKLCIEKLKQSGAELLLHAGDIVKRENLDLLKNSGLEYRAVLGNNDFHLLPLVDTYNLFQEPYSFTYQSLHVKLMHHPYFLTPDANLIVYGHTHSFEASVKNKNLFINPGEICARNKPLCECALLEVKTDSWEILRFTCNPNELIWKTQTIVQNHE
jgi:putative phosphoesterase